jgi:hypothetical protein
MNPDLERIAPGTVVGVTSATVTTGTGWQHVVSSAPPIAHCAADRDHGDLRLSHDGPQHNQVTDTANAPPIAGNNGAQPFLFAVIPTAAFVPTDVRLIFGRASSTSACR